MAEQTRSRTGLERLRRRVHGWLGAHPALYLPLVAHRRAYDGSRKAIGKDTEVVIEGFPRCGNSFAFAAFRLAQSRSVCIAHHLHAPAQVIAAARRRIPTVVVIRPPDDAVVSLLLRAPSWTADEAYTQYLRFYERILPQRERFVLATFAEVVADFGAVVRRLNERFGTSFVEFAHTPENVERCFEYVEDIARVNDIAGARFEMSVSRPSASRDAQKHALRASLMGPALAPLRAEAQRVHDLHVKGATA